MYIFCGVKHPSVLVVVLLALTACGSQQNSDVFVDCTKTPQAVTFSGQVLKVFNDSCIICHQPGTAVSQIPYLTVELAYEQLLISPVRAEGVEEFPPLVTPGDTENSQLHRKITADPRAGVPMPLFGSITEEEMCIIGKWIELGAAND